MKFTSGNFLYLFAIAFSLTGLSFTNVQVASSNKEFDEIIDAWHHAAATGDSVGFFSRMTEDALYLGTDETERWTRTTMGKDLGKFFNGKKAWHFIAYNRIYTALDDKNTILFDESLKTWMGPCKSTGMMRKVKGKWLISYYNLNVAVSNAVVQNYLKLLKEEEILKD